MVLIAICKLWALFGKRRTSIPLRFLVHEWIIHLNMRPQVRRLTPLDLTLWKSLIFWLRNQFNLMSLWLRGITPMLYDDLERDNSFRWKSRERGLLVYVLAAHFKNWKKNQIEILLLWRKCADEQTLINSVAQHTKQHSRCHIQTVVDRITTGPFSSLFVKREIVSHFRRQQLQIKKRGLP